MHRYLTRVRKRCRQSWTCSSSRARLNPISRLPELVGPVAEFDIRHMYVSKPKLWARPSPCPFGLSFPPTFRLLFLFLVMVTCDEQRMNDGERMWNLCA